MFSGPIPTIGALDFEFSRVPVECYSSSGIPYFRWIRWGMPKLGRYSPVLDSVCFLYETKAYALAGESIGGTGFFISYPSSRYPRLVHVHIVTNWHVAVHGAPSCPVVRMNKKDGGIDVREFEPSEWVFI